MYARSAYYQPSRKLSLVGLVMMLVGAAVASPLVGYAYGYLVAINPFIYINFFATVFAGCGVGLAVGWAAKKGQTPNSIVVGTVGALAGAALLYVQWYATLEFYGAEPDIAAPGLMWEQIGTLASLEPWTLFGGSPGSWGFAAIWAIEGVMLFGGSALLSVTMVDDPYCERCNRWTEVDQLVEPFDFVADAEHLKARLDRLDTGVLTAFEKVEVGTAQYAQLELINCPGCSDLRVVNVKNITIEVDKDGSEKKNDAPVVSHVLVDQSTYEAIKKS